MNDCFKLSISDLRIWVHLGTTEQEKQHPQLVKFNIDLVFKSSPKGCITDKIEDTAEDTACYCAIVKNIEEYCHDKRFNLIENLATSVHKIISTVIKNKIDNVSLITVTAHKLSPPVPGIHGGVSFTYSTTPLKSK